MILQNNQVIRKIATTNCAFSMCSHKYGQIQDGEFLGFLNLFMNLLMYKQLNIKITENIVRQGFNAFK